MGSSSWPDKEGPAENAVVPDTKKNSNKAIARETVVFRRRRRWFDFCLHCMIVHP